MTNEQVREVFNAIDVIEKAASAITFGAHRGEETTKIAGACDRVRFVVGSEWKDEK